MKNAVIATLVVALAVSIAAGVIAGASRTVNVEVRVWQDVDQPDSLWLSARPDGGSWADLGTIPVPLDDGLSGTGRYRYGDVVIALTVPPPPSCADASLAADCAVLLAARDALAGDGALNWSADVPLTEWDGVTVSGTPRRVTGLDLRNRGLTGSIPPELGSLPPTLSTVYLGGNVFTGCVPERLRLAANNDAHMMAHGLSWCPVALVPDNGTLTPGTTYQMSSDTIIIDIPATGPRIHFFSLVFWDGLQTGGLTFCFSDLNDIEGVCLDGITGEEWSRGSIEAHRRNLSGDDGSGAAGSLQTPRPPPGLDAVFDELVATARPAP